ncbi:MAG: DNA-processing protein DprA [Vicinamibacterales bacterium]
MDLQIAVAASMLPASRSLVGAIFKDVRHRYNGQTALNATLNVLGFPPEAHREILDLAMRGAEQALQRGTALGIRACAPGDSEYPPLLACIPDPPPVLWMRGDAAVLGHPTVAVIGSRAASQYALAVGERLGRELSERGVTVASGLARGVDSAAHRGSLAAGGFTAAVLGAGLDRIYPYEHRELAASISKQGVLVSELGPGAPPLAEHFPLRNRIISGISLAVVVVEASQKSGSLITARCGLEQGRDVMAVPGSVLTGRNRGSHALLKDGAKVVESADDILEGLGWAESTFGKATPGKPLIQDPLLAQMEPGEQYELEALAEMAGVTGARLLPRLMELELQGLVGAFRGRFSRLQ